MAEFDSNHSCCLLPLFLGGAICVALLTMAVHGLDSEFKKCSVPILRSPLWLSPFV